MTRATLRPRLGLELLPAQRDQVAPAAVTIAQCHFRPGAWLRGLRLCDTAVGLMAMVDPRVEPDPKAPPDAACLRRLMIDHRFQGRGYGRHAIATAKAVAEGWGLRGLVLHAREKPGGGAIPWYETLGFRRTGRVDDGQTVLIRP